MVSINFFQDSFFKGKHFLYLGIYVFHKFEMWKKKQKTIIRWLSRQLSECQHFWISVLWCSQSILNKTKQKHTLVINEKVDDYIEINFYSYAVTIKIEVPSEKRYIIYSHKGLISRIYKTSSDQQGKDQLNRKISKWLEQTLQKKMIYN